MKKIKKILIIFILVVVISGCNKTDSIIGSWVRVDNQNIEYNFNKNKTGTFISSNEIKEFTYEDRGTKVLIKFNDQTNSNEYDYSIENDILTIKGALNIALKRK